MPKKNKIKQNIHLNLIVIFLHLSNFLKHQLKNYLLLKRRFLFSILDRSLLITRCLLNFRVYFFDLIHGVTLTYLKKNGNFTR